MPTSNYMNRFIASFTKSEQQLIVFILVTVGVGCAMVQWKDSRQSTLSFNIAETTQKMPRMPDPVLPEGLDSSGLMDINIADGRLLETLPGIGPAMARAIIRHRERVGLFQSMDDLDKVPGIGPAMMARLAPMITFGDAADEPDKAGGEALPDAHRHAAKGGGLSPHKEVQAAVGVTSLAPTPAPMPGGTTSNVDAFRSPPRADAVNINTASADELSRLNGIGPSLAQRIVADRLHNGPFNEARDLDRVKGVGPSILRKNADMIRVK